MILDRIVARKREEVEEAKGLLPVGELRARIADTPPPRPFRNALLTSNHPVSLIAEVKRASPSKGLIRPDFDPIAIATAYASHGAAAISVLTDVHFFQGDLAYLSSIRKAVDLPLLRKEFIIDSYQVFESRAAFADAILLIVACLEGHQLQEYLHLAHELSMDAIVEVHDEAELATAIDAGANLIGINNRNLHTFETTLSVTERLARLIPADIPFISESGIFTRADILRVQQAGARAVLVGESLMRQDDIGGHMAHLLGLDQSSTSEGTG